MLAVANVVEGTVRRDGNRIRLTSKLIDARTDEIVWSETYDRDLTDIFAIQSEIAQTVASRLSARCPRKNAKTSRKNRPITWRRMISSSANRFYRPSAGTVGKGHGEAGQSGDPESPKPGASLYTG